LDENLAAALPYGRVLHDYLDPAKGWPLVLERPEAELPGTEQRNSA
jgi:hypothetical protein